MKFPTILHITVPVHAALLYSSILQKNIFFLSILTFGWYLS